MKYLFLLSFLLLTPTVYADDEADNDRVAEDHGYSKKQLKKMRKEKSRRIDGDAIAEEVSRSFENNNIEAAKYTDQALDAVINATIVSLKAYGYEKEADEIELDYALKYRSSFYRRVTGQKSIGDFPPLSIWLTNVHNKIEELLGEFLCKALHLHDIKIFNYGWEVVFNPTKYGLEDYREHFAGKLIWGWFWETHGFGGVVVYWIVNLTCGGFTSGMGLITFICGSISGMAENTMDKYIGPDLSEAIWQKANRQ